MKTIPCPAAYPRTGHIREKGVPPPPGPTSHVGKVKRERARHSRKIGLDEDDHDNNRET